MILSRVMLNSLAEAITPPFVYRFRALTELLRWFVVVCLFVCLFVITAIIALLCDTEFQYTYVIFQ